MPAPAAQMRGTVGERAIDVDVADRPDAAVTVVAIQGDGHRRDPEGIHQSGSHDTDDPAMPGLARDDHAFLRRLAVELDNLRAGLLGRMLSEQFALVVQSLDLLEGAPSLFGALGSQEAKGQVCGAEPAGGVEPGCEAKRHVASGELRGLWDLRRLPKRSERRPTLGGANRLQACANEPPVVPCQRRDVGDGSNRDEVEPRAEIERGTKLGTERGAQREGKTGAAESFVRKPAFGPMRVEKRECRQGFFGDEVVIDHDDVDPDGVGHGDALVIAGAAIAGDQQAWPLGQAAIDSLRAQSVSALESVGDERPHLSAERGDHLAENHRRRGAVHVVIPKHDDALPRPDRTSNPL